MLVTLYGVVTDRYLKRGCLDKSRLHVVIRRKCS